MLNLHGQANFCHIRIGAQRLTGVASLVLPWVNQGAFGANIQSRIDSVRSKSPA